MNSVCPLPSIPAIQSISPARASKLTWSTALRLWVWTLYLAIVFLVVANTIVGVQFLMSQQKTGRRYQTLIRLAPKALENRAFLGS